VHVQLKPRLRRVWRDDRTVQIGLTAERGTMLDGLLEADVGLLDRLRTGVDTAQIARGPARRRELVRLLDDAGVLVTVGPEALPPSPAAEVWSVVHPGSGDGRRLLAERARRRVLLRGDGPLADAVAGTLRAAGVERVAVAPGGDHPRDDDPGPEGRPDAGACDLVVLLDHVAADAAAADELVSLDVPHLSVVVREDDVLVGPLVRPGAGPCLRCLDLHRADRDPAWPSILAQVLGGPRRERRLEVEPALAVLVAGLVGLQVLATLDGFSRPATAGATLEVELPDGLVARREWPAHPACGCHWPPRPDGPPGRPGRSDAQMHGRGRRMDP
jgi:bacteriocin biosynthesis cyclodehydratase domain-containing protein